MSTKQRLRWWLSDSLLKLKMLWLYRDGPLREWWIEVWLQEPDARVCCDGRMCGCMGSCYGEMWEHLWEHRRLRK